MTSRLSFLLIIVFFISGINVINADEILSLKEAKIKGWIDYKASGNGESTHYLKPLKIIVRNRKDDPVKIKINSGRKFISKDTLIQNLIVTKEELITLKAFESKNVEVFSMCIQQYNGCPSDKAEYEAGEMADKKLLAVVKIIEENGYYNTIGQYAVWAITDDLPLDQISGYDTIAAKNLQKLTSLLTGKPIPIIKKGDYRTDYYCGNYKIRVYGTVEFTIPGKSEVAIAMFNKENMVVRELLFEPFVEPGTYEFKFSFDASVYTDPVYYIKLIINKDVKIVKELTLR